jgi:hypothetical protein
MPVDRDRAQQRKSLFLVALGIEIGYSQIILNPNEDLGFLTRSKCSRTVVRSALFAFMKSQLFIQEEYMS